MKKKRGKRKKEKSKEKSKDRYGTRITISYTSRRTISWNKEGSVVRRIDSRDSLLRTLMNPERAGSENKAPRVVQFEVETLLKNETKNALETMGMEIWKERDRKMKRKGRERKLDYRINVYLPNELAFNGLFENCAK